MNISSGKIITAQKVVIYGPEGIGKSTFASRFPDPLFIDTEGSTRLMDVRRFDRPESWESLQSMVRWVRDNPSECKTLVIDTLDWAEKLCIRSVLASLKIDSIESLGFGKCYVYVYEEFGKLLNFLEEVISAGIHVVCPAHAAMRKFDQPDEMGSYDRWEMKLQNSQRASICAMVKEWADMVLFASYKTIVVKDGKGDSAKSKAQGGRRIMYTSHHPCWDAKNRHGLPAEAEFDYGVIAHCFVAANAAVDLPQPTTRPVETPTEKPSAPPAEPKPMPAISLDKRIPAELRQLMEQDGICEAEIQYIVSKRGWMPADMPVADYPEDLIRGALVGGWAKVVEKIAEARRSGAMDIPF